MSFVLQHFQTRVFIFVYSSSNWLISFGFRSLRREHLVGVLQVSWFPGINSSPWSLTIVPRLCFNTIKTFTCTDYPLDVLLHVIRNVFTQQHSIDGKHLVQVQHLLVTSDEKHIFVGKFGITEFPKYYLLNIIF